MDHGERPAEALRPHSQQVLQLGDADVNGGCRGEASDQGLGEVNRHEAKPKKAKGQLTATGETETIAFYCSGVAGVHT